MALYIEKKLKIGLKCPSNEKKEGIFSLTFICMEFQTYVCSKKQLMLVRALRFL